MIRLLLGIEAKSGLGRSRSDFAQDRGIVRVAGESRSNFISEIKPS